MKGSTTNLVTLLNSAEKDPFAGVCISEKFRVSDAKSFFLYAFILAETLKMHSKSYKNRKIANEDFFESLRVDLHSRVII